MPFVRRSRKEDLLPISPVAIIESRITRFSSWVFGESIASPFRAAITKVPSSSRSFERSLERNLGSESGKAERERTNGGIRGGPSCRR